MPPTAAGTEAPIDLASKRAANEPDQTDTADLDAMRAEVATEPETEDEDAWPKLIPIGDATVRVNHYLDWPLSCDKQFGSGQFEEWAQKIIVKDGTGDDFADIWVPADPTLRQTFAFIRAVEVATGVPFAQHLGLPNS